MICSLITEVLEPDTKVEPEPTPPFLKQTPKDKHCFGDQD